MTYEKDMPILVFDSGVGGISVLKELVKVLPHENFIFFGDSKNSPYGTKSVKEIQKLTINNIKHFFNLGIKGLVIACNTATSASIIEVRRQFPSLAIVGIEPAIKPAVAAFPNGRILIMGTPITITGKNLKELIDLYKGDSTLIPLACPGLMEYVEHNKTNTYEFKEFLTNLLKPYIENPVDAFVTGCTHYPFIRKEIQNTLKNNPVFFDGANETSRALKRLLSSRNLLRENGKGHIEFLSSDTSEEKIALFKNLFEKDI